MASPFDPRSVFLARHAQHVVLIHFPIALFLIGVVLDMIAILRKDPRLATAAQVNLSSAAICIVPAYLTGFLAWHFALDGQRIKGVLLYHVIGASLSCVLAITTWWLRSCRRLSPLIQVIFEVVGAISISLTAHLGGFLSGVNT